jgi:hypothetical protein
MKALAEGQYIRHFQYGLGTVTASDGERTTIDFDDHGEKLFVTGLMSVELAGDAPARPARRRKKAPRKAVVR